MHMEISWKRQHAIEAAIQQELAKGPCGRVWDVRNLAHLDRVHDAAQNKVVVVFAYSRSCGLCKHVLKLFEDMSTEVRPLLSLAEWLSACTMYAKDHSRRLSLAKWLSSCTVYTKDHSRRLNKTNQFLNDSAQQINVYLTFREGGSTLPPERRH